MRPMRLIGVLFVLLALVACDMGQTPAPTASVGPATGVPAASPTGVAGPTLAASPAATSAATPAGSPVAGDEPLYLAIIWHQHQPVYFKDPETNSYVRPWVRVHATKDYVDMADILRRYPKVHATFNLTPSLLRQVRDLASGARDDYWLLTEVPAAALSAEQKRYLLRRFFDANDKMIARFPRYQELQAGRGDTGSDEAADAVAAGWSAQDFLDLQVLFNLAWTDPDWLAQAPLKALVDKGRGFGEDDKQTLLARHLELIEQVIPLHAELQQAGQIEVTMTPYAHPILPLLVDTNQAQQAMPDAKLPAPPFRYGQDAQAQLARGVALYQEIFGQPPRGMWPGEGSVGQVIVPMVADAGLRWIASDEEVLAKSIGLGAFERNSAETVQQADQLYRPYLLSGTSQPLAMVYRDRVISDKVGFTYSGQPGAQAADDFMARLEGIRGQLAGKQGPHLVTVILDGENAWEHYENDGKEFLNALYERLSSSATVKTVTPSEYLDMFQQHPTVESLWAGSWIGADFSTWIGEDEENKAWALLGDARKTLQKYINGPRKGDVDAATLERAVDLMYIAEGSDWFWWYGSDQDSGNDATFDQQFRDTLVQLHETLGAEVPPALYVPIIPAAAQRPDVAASQPLTVTVDGVATDAEWAGAGRFDVAGGVAQRADDVVGSLLYGFDASSLLLRLDARDGWAALGEDGRLGIYIGSTRAGETAPFSRYGGGGKTLLGFDAAFLAELRLAGGQLAGEPGLVAAQAGGWPDEPSQPITAALQAETVELAIPLRLLGEIEAGDVLGLRVVASRSGADIQQVPAGGLAELEVPDAGLTTPVLSVADAEGDDKGPGSYSYPSDAVFQPGVYDLTEFNVAEDANNLIFKLRVRGGIENPWGSPRGLSVQTFDIYLDTSAGGARKLLPGRNAAVAEGGWDYALWIEGWEGGLYQGVADGSPQELSGVEVKTSVDGPNGRITIRVPKARLPQGDPQDWRYLAVVLGQEGFPSAGVWRVRDISGAAEQWRFGGALGGTNGTRIIDVALPDDAPVAQQQALTPPRAVDQPNADLLAPEDLAQLPMLGAR